MLQLIKHRALAFLDYFRGRVVPMNRRPGILWASRYMTWLGKIFLHTPTFTEKELQAAKAAKKNTEDMGLGPLPEYMGPQFYWAKTDRTPKGDPAHINGSILLSIYRNKSYKDLSWRVAFVSLAFCVLLPLLGATTVGISNKVKSVAHKVANAVTGKSGPSPLSDDTDEIIPSDVRDAIAAAMAAKPTLTAAEQTYASDTNNCAPFLADMIVTNAAQAKGLFKTAPVMYELGQKLEACRKSGLAYRADLVKTLTPFQSIYGGQQSDKWKRLIEDTTLPGAWTPLSDFTKCDATLKDLANSPAPAGPAGFLQVHSAADCISNGSAIPTSTQNQD
jgi:hypothetical protein